MRRSLIKTNHATFCPLLPISLLKNNKDMEQNIKQTLLDSIGTVYEKSENCKLEADFYSKVEAELAIISDYFKVSQKQAFIIANIFTLNYKGDSVDLNDLIKYFDCNPIKILEFSHDLKDLYSLGIFSKEKRNYRVKTRLTYEQFAINELITHAILNNEPMPVLKSETTNQIQVIEVLYELGEKSEDDEISVSDLFFESRKLIRSNLHFPLIKKLHDFKFSDGDTFTYIYLIWETIRGNESVEIARTANKLFDNESGAIWHTQTILLNQNILTRENYIEIIETDFLNDAEMKLSDKSIKMLEEFDLKISCNKKKKYNIIEPAKIDAKTLYFNEAEQHQLTMLYSLLEDEKFKETQRRLQNKSLPKGITILLHGGPGTGKTETVYQVAKATNREIVKVEISATKSMWFGESEKKIKQIFTDYNTFAKDCELMPILFFNEADAIISKRKENGTSNVSQTENAIQNILLEELENFEGIFFATTNLVKNLDSAFERRFLFKIEFHKPEISVKANIWKSKLPTLSDSECETLAARFDFSGGQIDNIVRKNEIQEIIQGITVDFNTIFEFCKVELLVNKKTYVGFKHSN